MHIELIPTLIDQYRETFEGEVEPGKVWITSGPRASAVLGTVELLTHDEAFAAPPGASTGGKSIAAHVAHLAFALELTAKRFNGENPDADWPGSFVIPQATLQTWETLKAELRDAYEGVLTILQHRRGAPIGDWPPLHVAGLTATISHNAYHLGAIRQLAKAVHPNLR